MGYINGYSYGYEIGLVVASTWGFFA